MEISDIKLRVNHNVNFNLEDAKIKNLLIIGNTINFFGFFNDGRINMMSMNKNDRYHYMWLLKRCKEKTNIYIIGESEECEYYTNIFNYFGSLGIRVNWKFMETKEPKDYLEKLYNESCKSNADVVICNFYRYYENLNLSIPVLLKKSKGLYSNHSILKSLIPDILIHSYLWNKLWKKELFNNLKFPNIKYEDISVMCDLFYKTKKVAIINDTLYYYRIRKTSIVRNYSISTQNDYFKSYGFIRLFLKNNELYNKYKLSFTLLSIKVFFVMFFINIFLIDEYKDFKITLENFKSFYKFICHANSSKYDYSMNDLLDLNVLQKCTNTLISEKSTE